MNQERLLQVLLSPITSEKSIKMADKNSQVTFRVVKDASKTEVRNAVQTLFKVDVISVKSLNVKGKRKRFGKAPGKRSDWKKVYVRLKAGQDINFANT